MLKEYNIVIYQIGWREISFAQVPTFTLSPSVPSPLSGSWAS